MPRELIVNYSPYHRATVKPQNFEEFVQMYETAGKPTGLWSLKQQDRRTGRIIKELWNPNAITDAGAISLLERGINSSGATLPNLFNNLLITNNSGSTTLTTAIAANTSGITSLAVAALPAAIPSGTILTLGFGSGTNQQVTTSAAEAHGATSITVISFSTDASHIYAVGTAVVPNPATTDNPTNTQLTGNVSSGLTSYSGNLATGAFTFTQGTGAGNRQLVVSFTFTNSGGTSIGNYTDAWIVNVSSGATSGNYMAHEINTPMRCDTSNNITATVTIKL